MTDLPRMHHLHVADLAVVFERPRVTGFPVLPDTRLPGFDRFYTEDPFGNRIEILTPRVPHP